MSGADEYIASVMVSNYGVPIEALVNAPIIQAITSQAALVKSAVFECPHCFLDKDFAVRPWSKPEANTLILRDIASNTSNEEILAIFGPDKGFCPTPASVRADMNDTWFVTFASESDCKDALVAITTQKREFAGKRVSARLKTTSAKPIYTGPNMNATSAPSSLSPFGSPDSFFDPNAFMQLPLEAQQAMFAAGMPMFPQGGMNFMPPQYAGMPPNYMPQWPVAMNMMMPGMSPYQLGGGPIRGYMGSNTSRGKRNMQPGRSPGAGRYGRPTPAEWGVVPPGMDQFSPGSSTAADATGTNATSYIKGPRGGRTQGQTEGAAGTLQPQSRGMPRKKQSKAPGVDGSENQPSEELEHDRISANGNGNSRGSGRANKERSMSYQSQEGQTSGTYQKQTRSGQGQDTAHKKGSNMEKGNKAKDKDRSSKLSEETGTGEVTKDGKKATHSRNTTRGQEGGGKGQSKSKRASDATRPDFNMEVDFPTTLGTSGGTSNAAGDGNMELGTVGSSAWAAIARRVQSDAGNQANASVILASTTAASLSNKNTSTIPASVSIPEPVPVAVAPVNVPPTLPAIIFGSFTSPAESVAAASIPRPVSTSSQGTQTHSLTASTVTTTTISTPAITTQSHTTRAVSHVEVTQASASIPPPATQSSSSSSEVTTITSSNAAWGQTKRSFADVMKTTK